MFNLLGIFERIRKWKNTMAQSKCIFRIKKLFHYSFTYCCHTVLCACTYTSSLKIFLLFGLNEKRKKANAPWNVHIQLVGIRHVLMMIIVVFNGKFSSEYANMNVSPCCTSHAYSIKLSQIRLRYFKFE